MGTMTLRDIFHGPVQFPWNHVLYLPREEEITLDTECLVLDPNDVESEHDVPSPAMGLVEGLGIQDVRAIQENARLQGKTPTDTEMLRAFVYYLENDAFIEFG